MLKSFSLLWIIALAAPSRDKRRSGWLPVPNHQELGTAVD
jgi:hypothetical protein